jgi:hypothetical protein
LRQDLQRRQSQRTEAVVRARSQQGPLKGLRHGRYCVLRAHTRRELQCRDCGTGYCEHKRREFQWLQGLRHGKIGKRVQARAHSAPVQGLRHGLLRARATGATRAGAGTAARATACTAGARTAARATASTGAGRAWHARTANRQEQFRNCIYAPRVADSPTRRTMPTGSPPAS